MNGGRLEFGWAGPPGPADARHARMPWPSGAQISYIAGLLTIITLGLALFGGLGFASRRRR